MRSISIISLVIAAAAIVGCADLLGIEPWHDPTVATTSSSHSSSSSGETSSGDGAAGSGSVDPCRNGFQDGAETGVDCGGGTCDPCADGQGCLSDADCESAYCPASRGYCLLEDGRTSCGTAVMDNPSCGDCVKNGIETDVDCGGDCLPCRSGKSCTNDGECWSNVCSNGECDLGAAKTRCFSNADCMSGVCAAAVLMSECTYDNCCQ